MNRIIKYNSHAQDRLLRITPDPITRGYSEPIEPSEGVQSLKEQRYIDIPIWPTLVMSPCRMLR